MKSLGWVTRDKPADDNQLTLKICIAGTIQMGFVHGEGEGLIILLSNNLFTC